MYMGQENRGASRDWSAYAVKFRPWRNAADKSYFNALHRKLTVLRGELDHVHELELLRWKLEEMNLLLWEIEKLKEKGK